MTFLECATYCRRRGLIPRCSAARDDDDCDEEIHPRTLNDVIQNGANRRIGRQDALKNDVLPPPGLLLPLRIHLVPQDFCQL